MALESDIHTGITTIECDVLSVSTRRMIEQIIGAGDFEMLNKIKTKTLH